MCPIFGMVFSKMGIWNFELRFCAYISDMKSRTVLFTLLYLTFFVACQNKKSIPPESLPLSELTKMLENQSAEWNKGNLKGFMDYYWKSDSLRFITGNKDLQGWDSVFSSYQRSFPKLEDAGKLTFSDLKSYVLADNLANVTGQWHIERPKGNVGGKFSLICRYREERWEIILDHTW